MVKNIYFSFLLFFALTLLHSCGVYNSNGIFRQSKKSVFPIDSLSKVQNTEQKIKVGDRMTFSFATNKGEKVVMNLGGIESGFSNKNTSSAIPFQDYLVQANGIVFFPVLGEVSAEGLTVRELELKLEKLLAANYQDPFVQIKISNQRIIVFTGKNAGQVIPLLNTNTTLIEIIASAGGLQEFSKATSVKLVRDMNGKRKVYQVDLSKIENIQHSDITVLNGDLIYIDYHPRVVNNVLRDASPWISIISSTLAIYTFLSK